MDEENRKLDEVLSYVVWILKDLDSCDLYNFKAR